MQLGYLSEVFTSFQGEGLHVGRRHLFVRFAACNLRCTYCDTPDSLERVEAYMVWRTHAAAARCPNPISAIELTALASSFFESDGPIDGIALTGGEPLLQAGFLREWLSKSRFPVPILLETNGMLPSKLEEVVDLVDIVSMDLKLPSNTGERAFWPEHGAFAELASRRQLYVKILVNEATDAAEFERAISVVAALPDAVPVFIQPVTGEQGSLKVGLDTLARFHALARRQLGDVRVVPQVHKLLGLR